MKIFDSHEVADAMGDLLNELMGPGLIAFVNQHTDKWVITIHDGTGSLVGHVDDVAETIREYIHKEGLSDA